MTGVVARKGEEGEEEGGRRQDEQEQGNMDDRDTSDGM